MADILDELLDEQNYEKRLKYFQKYLLIIVIFTIFGAGFIFLYNYNNDKTKAQNMKLSAVLINSIDNLNSSNDLQNLISQDISKVSELAALEQINIKMSAKNKDTDGAKHLLEQIIQNSNYSKLTVNYAKILWISLIIDQKNLNATDQIALDNYLKSFNNENEPLYGTATLLHAFKQAKTGQKDLAIKTLKTIISSKSSSNITKDQAKALISNLSY